MKKLLKFLFKTLFWLFIIVVVAIVVGYLTMSSWIKPLVSVVVPKITKTEVSLKSADIALFSGRFGLNGLKIANPTGFAEPYIFELGEISVQFQPKSVLTDKIIVDKVLIKDTQIVAEYNQRAQMNLMVLKNNVQKNLSQGKTEPTTQTPANTSSNTGSKSTKSVIIKDLQILDTSVRFAVLGSSVTIPLPNIQEKNIGEKKKTTLVDSIQMVVDKLTMEPIKEMGKTGEKALSNAFKAIEQHTNDAPVLKNIKDTLSGFGLF